MERLKLKKGMVYFAGSDCDEHIEEAKKYIDKNGWTKEDVRLVRRTIGEQSLICVIGNRTERT